MSAGFIISLFFFKEIVFQYGRIHLGTDISISACLLLIIKSLQFITDTSVFLLHHTTPYNYIVMQRYQLIKSHEAKQVSYMEGMEFCYVQ
jgi:hypothetical protein